MWDVNWEEPKRELVGQRRARKKLDKVRSQSRMSGLATARSTPSSMDRPIDPSTPKGTQDTTPSKPSRSWFFSLPLKSPASTKRSAGPSMSAKSLAATNSGVSSATIKSSMVAATAPTVDTILERESRETSLTSLLSTRDSIFSRYTEPKSTFIPDPTPYMPAVSRPPRPAASLTVIQKAEIEKVPHTPDARLAPRSTTPDTPVNLTPSLRSPLSLSGSHRMSIFKPNNPDSWTPMRALHYESFPPSIRSDGARAAGHRRPYQQQHRPTPTPDSLKRLEIMQQTLRRMAQTSAYNVLERLGQVWTALADPETEIGVYRKFDTEQKYWMMSSLSHLDPVVEKNTRNPTSNLSSMRPKTNQICALYETHARTAYLAGVHYSKDVYHLSAVPLPDDFFANIHPVYVPSLIPSAFPTVTKAFDTVHSLTFPALCAAFDIPGILSKIQRALAPGGSFQVTVIDPMPVAETLGPRMRVWLEEHLLINMENQFRCITPSKLFPVWLGDAGLRGVGSSITTSRFVAVPPGFGSREPNNDPTRAERTVKNELRTVTGRMLWLEVWGQFVKAPHWWWEDLECVEECVEMGTYWEYSLIDSVKEQGPDV